MWIEISALETFETAKGQSFQHRKACWLVWPTMTGASLATILRWHS